MLSVLKFLRWLFQKVAAALLMVVLALGAYGLWIFLRDNVDFDLHRHEIVRAMNGERTHIREALIDVDHRLEQLTQSIAAEKERVAQAQKVMGKLKDLESTWDKLIGNPEQQAANAQQIVKMEELRQDALTKIEDLQRRYSRTTWERDGLEVALGKLEAQIVKVEAQRSKVMHYLLQAWERLRWWLFGALALYFLGPTVGKLFMYYGIAPTVMRGRPVRLSAKMAPLPEIGQSRVSLDLGLAAGERLWIRERFLQASDEGLRKRTRFLLDWRIPFTCLASGLVELVELQSADAGETEHITLSNQSNPHIELCLITLPEGSSIILRPSFLAGATAAEGQRVRIRRRWQIFRWQAWVTLQFRYFEFVGPSRLIIAGSRGVRAERLAKREGDRPSARRTNQDATVGFTPNLDYKPVRAETFWGYYRGMNPLFDDLFSGNGLFLCQEISTEGDAGRARKFWAGLWGSMLKVFGL
jgi:hypothetical protein